MNGIYANRTSHRDFIISEFERLARPESEVFIATAFFTELSVLRQLVEEKHCRVYLVVRLGFPTSPDAIAEAMKMPGVQLRVYTGRGFHPKLYLFDDAALVGSANLTHSAITSNQEVMVALSADDPRYESLRELFDDYWSGAEVPTPQQLADYRLLYQRFERLEAAEDQLAREVINKLGDRSPDNIQRGQRKQTTQSVFEAAFRRRYQEAVVAFDVLRRAYQASGYRKVDESAIPLRLEIDSFISYVRERHAVGEEWRKTAPYRTPTEQAKFIDELMLPWQATYWRHFEEDIVASNYPRLKKVFASREIILAADDDTLFDALASLHSFYERLRYFSGGLPTFKQAFLAANDPKRLRESLAHLLFGPGDLVRRMAAVLFDEEWKLRQFGPSNVQELVGWCNGQDLPVVNDRTVTVLRYLGARVG